MSQTNTNYLFQAIPPGSDRAPSFGRASNDAPSFGEHLNDAAPSVFDVVRHADRVETKTEARNDDEDRRNSANDDDNSDIDGHASGTAAPSNESDGDASRPAEIGAHSCEASNANGCADDEHSDSDDNGDDETTAVADPSAAAASSPSQNAQLVAPPDAKASTDEGAAEAAVDDAVRDKSAAAARQKADGNVAVDTNATGSAKQDLTVAAAPAVDGAANAAQVHDALNAESKPNDGTSAKPNASNSKNSAREKADGTEGRPAVPGPAAIASDTGAKSLDQVLSTPNAGTSSKEPLTADAPKPTDADSRRRTKSSARAANTRADTELPATKSETSASAGPTTNIATPAVAPIGTIEKTAQPAKPGAAKSETSIGQLTSAMRSATEMSRGGRHTETTETPQVDPNRFIGRVAKAFHTAQERGGTLQLRLSPPELGALKLQLTVKDGVLTAALETESADTRRLLLDHLPALRDRLAEQNIRVDRFDVDVRQDQNRDQSNPRGMNQNAHQHQPERPEPKSSATTSAKAKTAQPPESPTANSRIGNSSINLVV